MSSSVAEQVVPGTRVTTVEAMQGLPEGTSLDVTFEGRTERWQRTEAGWVLTNRGGNEIAQAQRIPVAERFFVGVLSSGQVRVPGAAVPQFTVGMVLTTGRYTYVVHTVNEDGSADVGVFRDHWVGTDHIIPLFLTRSDVGPAPGDLLVSPLWLVEALAWFHGQQAVLTTSRDLAMEVRNRATRELAAARAASGTPPDLIAALHEYAGSVQDPDLDNLLDEHGIARRQQVSVTVTISGYNYVTISEEQAAEALELTEAQITDIDESSRVRWRKEFTVDREVNPGDCACDDVSDEDGDVTDQVPDDSDTWEIDSTHCQNG